MRAGFFAVMGYLTGSILFAELFARLFKKDIYVDSRDKNPGTANAFMYGGFWCGFLTLCGELLKGFLPVAWYLKGVEIEDCSSAALAVVLMAPIVGHIYPLFFQFHGGKGIAVTFGCLLGLAPVREPVALFAFFFLFFSGVIRISPHIYRTAVTYGLTAIVLFLFDPIQGISLGFGMITLIVWHRLYRSKEEKERMKVGLLWRH